MDRRRFLLTSLAGALAAPLVTEGQQAGKVYRIGYLENAPSTELLSALSAGLRERGWVEGQNFVWERRFSKGRNERFPSLAAELVQGKPDIIITAGTAPTLAAKAVTQVHGLAHATLPGHGMATERKLRRLSLAATPVVSSE
jgi:putative ABC transport system substrate-binding protein